jgi:hypothetical protein
MARNKKNIKILIIKKLFDYLCKELSHSFILKVFLLGLTIILLILDLLTLRINKERISSPILIGKP